MYSPDSYQKLKKGCSWLRIVFAASDQDIMLSSGYNAIFQLKLIKYLMIYFAICTVIGRWSKNSEFFSTPFLEILILSIRHRRLIPTYYYLRWRQNFSGSVCECLRSRLFLAVGEFCGVCSVLHFGLVAYLLLSEQVLLA